MYLHCGGDSHSTHPIISPWIICFSWKVSWVSVNCSDKSLPAWLLIQLRIGRVDGYVRIIKQI